MLQLCTLSASVQVTCLQKQEVCSLFGQNKQAKYAHNPKIKSSRKHRPCAVKAREEIGFVKAVDSDAFAAGRRVHELPAAYIDAHVRETGSQRIEEHQIAPLQAPFFNRQAGARPLNGAARQHAAGKSAKDVLHQPAAVKACFQRVAAVAVRHIDCHHGAGYSFLTLAGIQLQRAGNGQVGYVSAPARSACARAINRTARRRGAAACQQQGYRPRTNAQQELAALQCRHMVKGGLQSFLTAIHFNPLNLMGLL